MAEPIRSELYAIEDPPLTPVSDSNGHHSSMPVQDNGSGEESTFVFPASREQSRYWMLAQLDPDSTASNMAISFDIEGLLDDTVAEQAIAALTMRHEALRTIFRLESGVLSQVVLERPLYSFATEVLSTLSANERAEAAAAAVSRHGHTVIDLHHGPVLHALLIHIDDRHHIMALTMNHIVCDGWSNGLLIRDFTVIYEALLAHREPVLPELPFQFADFSLWQNEYLEGPAAEEAATFWKTHITTDLPALDLPTDSPRTSGRSFPGHIESALLPREIDEQLKAYCRKSGSTKHIVLLAVFEALCARYTGQTEFLLGSTIANRTQPGMEDVVGRFANPQIIVAKVDGDPTFAELEQRVRNWETAAYNHQDLPFSRIIEDFQIDQAGATSQFLQVWFLYQKAFMQPQTGETIRVTPRRSVSGGVDFDLLVSIVERAEGPRVQMEYNTQLFKPERIQSLIKGFIELLGAALHDPSVPLSRLAFAATANDAAGSPSALSPTPTSRNPAPQAQSISLLGRLHANAQRIPAESAFVEASRQFDWQQLEASSSAVAAELIRRGVNSEAIAALCLTPQAESVIAFAAALKTGAKVLPLPTHASERDLLRLLQQLDGAWLLAPKSLLPAMSQRSICYEDFATLAPAGNLCASNAASFLFLKDAATATFIAASVDEVTRSVDAAASAVFLQQGEALLAFPATDPSCACLDVLLALASGSQLSYITDARTLEQQLAQQQVTRLLLAPSDLKKLAATGWQGDRRVALTLRGGRLSNALSAFLPQYTKTATRLFAPAGGGPVAAYQVVLPKTQATGLLPLTASALTIQGPDGNAAPAGAFGELYTSDGASLGYMASTTTTGSIELLDAADRYLLLRGHRVCLGDIEDALIAQPHLADAFAYAPANADHQSLTAYLIADSNSADRNSLAVRSALSAVLPSHLVPSDYVWLDQLPRSLDGRVAADLLPQAEAPAQSSRSSDHPAELTAAEEKLSAIWREVLGLRHVDIHTPFFDLGGSSLLLVRLFARINKAFDSSLPITAIFDAQTIAELALTLGGATEISPLVQVQPHGTRPPLFMVHSYLLYKGLSSTLGPDQPFYGLRELDRDGHLTIEERVTRYVREIRRIQPQGPYHLAGWCAAGPLTVEVARQLMLAEQEVSYLALFDSWLPGYLDSIEPASTKKGWLPYETVSMKLAFHRSKMRGLTTTKKARYLWMAMTRIAKEAQYRIYLRNWERLRKLSEKYHFALPQFMHNTSLDTFSALKEYREQHMPIRITLIRASDSREVPNAAASCGWERVADLGVDVLWAPGDHETMFVGDNLKVTASIVQRGLNEALANSSAKSESKLADALSLRGAALHVDCPST